MLVYEGNLRAVLVPIFFLRNGPHSHVLPNLFHYERHGECEHEAFIAEYSVTFTQHFMRAIWVYSHIRAPTYPENYEQFPSPGLMEYPDFSYIQKKEGKKSIEKNPRTKLTAQTDVKYHLNIS